MDKEIGLMVRGPVLAFFAGFTFVFTAGKLNESQWTKDAKGFITPKDHLEKEFYLQKWMITGLK